ncbi:MAG TPA: hypothetical protein VFB45_22380 [Pseudolabrys sp.]|nr:hypothetical protein [Pseudolabrys sp.]
MKKLTLALAALAAVGFAIPSMTSVARAEDKVIIKKGGHHHDWMRAHAESKKKIIIKKDRD